MQCPAFKYILQAKREIDRIPLGTSISKEGCKGSEANTFSFLILLYNECQQALDVLINVMYQKISQEAATVRRELQWSVGYWAYRPGLCLKLMYFMPFVSSTPPPPFLYTAFECMCIMHV